MTRVPSRQHAASWLGASTLFLSLVSLPACTSMLGIDGQYVQDDSTGALGHRRDSGAGGDPSAGGAQTNGAGGSSGAGAGGEQGAGGDTTIGGSSGADSAAPMPDTCKTGLYTGTFSGSHTPAVALGFAGDPKITNGVVSFRLDGTTTPLTISQSDMTGSFVWGKFTAKLTGTYECDTGTLIAHLHGALNALGPLSPVIDGEFIGDLLGDPATRKWSEQEANTSGSVGHGSGTWSATWSKP